MTDYKRAVELADGFEIHSFESSKMYFNDPEGTAWQFGDSEIPQMVKDALAAQLVRQVDELRYSDSLAIIYERYRVAIHQCGKDGKILGEADGPDRTDNTINAILESGVLE